MTDAAALNQITTYLPTPSKISHHNSLCCRRAKSWLLAIDHANSFVSDGYDPPVWLRRQFGWAPHKWPIYWCQIPLSKELDCGSLAALATELFIARGVEAYQVQLALEYPSEAISVWQETWQASLGHSDWISSSVCYHEACALPTKNEVDLWDPTEGRWMTKIGGVPQRYGQLLAIRIVDDSMPKPLYSKGLPLK